MWIDNTFLCPKSYIYIYIILIYKNNEKVNKSLNKLIVDFGLSITSNIYVILLFTTVCIYYQG